MKKIRRTKGAMKHKSLKTTKVVPEIEAIRKELDKVLSRTFGTKKVGTIKCGVYAFYDYDLEPIYVGQTEERLSSRIKRHLTNQRTDAVAMGVLDPREVAFVKLWPLDLAALNKKDRRIELNRAESTVFYRELGKSRLKAILNEKVPSKLPESELPEPIEGQIVPEDIFQRNKHPDLRIARRALTISNLAKTISERKVTKGLRLALLNQAIRLKALSESRLKEI